MFLSKIKHHLYAFFILAIDVLPESIVKTEWYFRIRKRVSQVPQRFEPYPAEMPPRGSGVWRGRKLVTRKTDLVIDGYPGSANSFVANSIGDGLPDHIFIESHFHHTVQLKRALALGVPAVVLVRKPLDACNSHKSKEPSHLDIYLLIRWIIYYQYVLKRSSSLCIFFFNEIIRDIDILRRNCPAVQALIHEPIQPNISYRRSSERQFQVDENIRLNRPLLAWANRIYNDLQFIGEAKNL